MVAMVLQFLKRAEVSANDNLMSVFVDAICQNGSAHRYLWKIKLDCRYFLYVKVYQSIDKFFLSEKLKKKFDNDLRLPQ